MKARTLVIGTGIPIVVAVFYLDQRATRAELAELRAALPKATAERAMKAPEVVWLSRPSEQVPVAVPMAKQLDPPEVASMPVTTDLTKQKPAGTPIEQFVPVHDTLEAAFVSEVRDSAWATDARRAAESKLSAELPPKSILKSIDCRSSLCRVESTHDGYAYAKTFVNRLATPEGRPWNGAFYAGPVSQDPQGGAVTFITYLAREGTEMPTVADH